MNLEIDDLRFILALERQGSLAALARQENVTPPAITKRLHALERRVGARLVLRTPRRLQLTHEGQLIAAEAVRILQDMRALEEALRERSEVVAGRLKVHGPLGFGRQHLAPLIAEFRRTHPRVETQLLLSDSLRPDRFDTQGHDAFDLSIAIGEVPDSRWIAHRIAPNRRILCASPAYLAGAPALTHPADLTRHTCLVLRENDEDVSLWRFASPPASRTAPSMISVRVQGAMQSNDGEVIRRWCVAGMGVMIRSEWDVAASLRSGELVAPLRDYPLRDADIVALVAPSRVGSARARLFVQALKNAFAPYPPWRGQ